MARDTQSKFIDDDAAFRLVAAIAQQARKDLETAGRRGDAATMRPARRAELVEAGAVLLDFAALVKGK